MKAWDIAIKDLTQSFRSAFAVIFMFGVPLLMTGMFYIMFGGMSNDDESAFALPTTRVVIANLDEGFPDMQGLPGNSETGSLGEVIAVTLQQDEFANLMEVNLVDSSEAAHLAVDRQEAGLAIIIPKDFSRQFTGSTSQAVLRVYQDPTLTIGPAIVRSLLSQFMDGMSGGKIAASVILSNNPASDPAQIAEITEAYLAFSTQVQSPETLVEVHAPAAAVGTANDSKNAPSQQNNLLMTIIGPIMGGMLIFYAFYTGTTTAQTVLKEDEEGTLPRLFTTPTPQSTILSGKLLAVFMTVLVQVVVLLILGRLIFKITWGGLLPVSMMSAGTIIVAATFGVFINSLIKNTKQGGLIYGGLLTVTGMLGMMPIFTQSVGGTPLDIVSLAMPQGWAVRGLLQCIRGASSQAVFLTTLVMLAWSLVFFCAGVWRFQKRYAQEV